MRAGLCLVRLCWIALFAASALAQEPGASAQAARPEIGKPIQAAIELLKSKKGKEALAKVREAQEVGDRTPYENYLVERVLGQAAAAAGEPSIAARAFENVATSSASPEGERRQFFAAAASQYYLIKSYAKLAEEPLQLLANSCAQIKDAACYGKAMEMLVAHHPKRDYWLGVIYSIATRRGFSERLAIDVARLKIATGTMRGADEYLDAAQLSLQDGFPIEAV